MGNKTLNALLTRGIDNSLAEKLITDGYNINNLKRLSNNKLLELGISPESILAFKGRPPIPNDTATRLIHDFKNVCTICRGEKSSSIIIHHIHPWQDSKSHDYDNLILLCPACHDEAHSTHTLSQNLTPDKLLNLKERRKQQIQDDDSKSLDVTNSPANELMEKAWDYFNHQLILRRCPNKKDLLQILQSTTNSQDGKYIYRGNPNDNYYMYKQFNSALNKIITQKRYFIINNQTSPGDILALAKPQAIVILTARHYFKNQSNSVEATGPGQIIICSYKKASICFRFIIDRWDATSTSAYGIHLSGSQVRTSILIIKDVTKEGKDYILFRQLINLHI